MNRETRRDKSQPTSGFLLVEHIITVGEQVIYKGSDWQKAQRIFTLNAQSASLDSVRHEVNKSLINYHQNGEITYYKANGQ